MTAGGRFLFVTWPGGGNLPPLLALGVMLTERGHEVTVVAPEAIRGRVEAEGLGFEAHRTPAGWCGGEGFTWPPGPTPEQQLACLRGLASDVDAALDRRPVDIAIVDYMQPEALSAVERRRVPTAAFVHTLYWRVARGPFSPMEMVSGGRDPVNAVRAELGLAAVDALPEMLDTAARVLVTVPRQLDRPDSPDSPDSPGSSDDADRTNVRYVGPIVERPGPDAGWTPPWSADQRQRSRPAILISISTIASTDQAVELLQRVIDAASDLPVTLFVTTTDEAKTGLRPSANTHLSSYVRHSAVLPHVDLFVTHAGLSSVGAAVHFGVPMVCIPQFHEQPANAEHVAAAGLGRALPTDAPAAGIRTAIEAALVDDEMRATAAAMSAHLRDQPGGVHPAVRELESLLGRS
ncbi:MAG: glycosyltransferase [Catenulispora sp.]